MENINTSRMLSNFYGTNWKKILPALFLAGSYFKILENHLKFIECGQAINVKNMILNLCLYDCNWTCFRH